MAVLISTLFSSAYTSMFYLIMVWTLAPDPLVLGGVIALYELLPNVMGVVWGQARLRQGSTQQLRLGWILRGTGILLLLFTNLLPLQIAGVALSAITTMVVASIEKAAAVKADALDQDAIRKFARLRQIQLAASLLMPVLTGYLLTGHLMVVLALLAIILVVGGVVVSGRVPALSGQAPTANAGSATTAMEPTAPVTGSERKPVWWREWFGMERLRGDPVIVGVVVVMLLANLLLWGPEGAVLPAYFTVQRLTAADLGLAISVGRVGGLAGSVVVGNLRIASRWVATALAATLAIYASAYIFMGTIASHVVLRWCLILFVANVVEAAVYPLLNTAITQRYTAGQDRAAATATVVSLGNLGEPVGALAGGAAAARNPSLALVLMGVLGVAVGCIGCVSMARYAIGEAQDAAGYLRSSR